ncbi:GbsR/MarR family transcriptional regulator [Garciella nitratireducens]|uniref:GbsR/MarR family transcriptional regulator n=1 Tax=Garciella nitratireducens TaxID=218205 RepID=UPI001BD34B2A|nr:hypothetical protein [Garciella nitratireducens]
MIKNNTQIANAIEEIKNNAILNLAKLIKLYGLTPSEARLFSMMFLENVPMTLDDMSKSLGMSKTSMSTGIHGLLDAQMVEETWKKGIRKDLYKTEDNLYKSFANTFIKRWLSEIEKNQKIFYKILNDINSILLQCNDKNIKTSLSNYVQKIEYIIQFYNWLEQIFKEMASKAEKQ